MLYADHAMSVLMGLMAKGRAGLELPGRAVHGADAGAESAQVARARAAAAAV